MFRAIINLNFRGGNLLECIAFLVSEIKKQ